MPGRSPSCWVAKLSQTTTKFPAESDETEEFLCRSVVKVFTWNSGPTGWARAGDARPTAARHANKKRYRLVIASPLGNGGVSKQPSRRIHAMDHSDVSLLDPQATLCGRKSYLGGNQGKPLEHFGLVSVLCPSYVALRTQSSSKPGALTL